MATLVALRDHIDKSAATALLGHSLSLERELVAVDARCNFLEQLQPLAGQRALESGETGDVAARPRQARDEAAADRIGCAASVILPIKSHRQAAGASGTVLFRAFCPNLNR